MNQNNVKILDHEYDGIQELDNPLPGWWLATFYGTIVFAALYLGYYLVGGGPSHKDELNAARKEVEQMRAASPEAKSAPSEEVLMAILQKPERLQAGAKVFVEKCVACHGAKGEGSIGPNLTDNYWIHGDGKASSIAQIVNTGVADKGMPPWGPLLKDEELQNVTAYVYSLRGTNPPNAKAPQGTEIKN